MATSKTSICNQALLRIGAAEILDMDEQSEEARFCRAFYDDVRKAVLRDHPWNFAVKTAPVALLEDEEIPDWLFAYQIPSDCIRLIKLLPAGYADQTSSGIYNWAGSETVSPNVGTYNTKDSLDSGIEYELRGRNILTNTELIHVKYIRDEENITLFDDMFTVALTYRLAADLALPLTQEMSRQQAMMEMYERSAFKARGKNASEKRRSRNVTLLEARG